MNYLKSAEELLGFEFDCERDFKVTAKPVVTQVQADKSSGYTGGNPGLGTNDPLSSCQSNLEDIRIGAAWEAARSSKQKLKDVVLAVIDTGVDPDHPDLVGQFHKNPSDGSIGYNFIKNNADVNDDNEYGHGTHCAGNAAARTNNSIGIAGVANADAATPNVKLMILKFLDENGSGSASDSLRALNYAVEHGATISSHSYGGPSSSAVLEQALKKAAAAEHVAVVAAGNDGANVDKKADYPCNYAKNNPSVVCVAASTSSPSSPIKLASFSNAGSTTKIAAPGVDINSTSPGKRYAKLSGTSMSTPTVAGVAALLATLGVKGEKITDAIIRSRTADIPNDLGVSGIGEVGGRPGGSPCGSWTTD
ncbi:hypothetical protein FOZ63_026145 [Perkinsus olseni]|uniref:subtilisin n=1 Tax=Perkinsus olseni TaxID=32597 RepID=A0A7J6Q0X7_PEROL|nr:hypothetical protein FOZ60_011385 [Perkinsus olseni]KAF4701200.1 hypothetical protein FOZ63_026145 [Perkinsus olseni]